MQRRKNDAPIHCVRSSLPDEFCADCARDATQSDWRFSRVTSLIDVFERRANYGVVSRLLFAQLDRAKGEQHALVEYRQRLLQRRWLNYDGVPLLRDVATADVQQAFSEAIERRLKDFAKPSTVIDRRIEMPGVPPSELFASELVFCVEV